jgi:hypothetical protein
VLSIYLLGIAAINNYLNSRSVELDNSQIIAIGDSHIMTGLNPNLASKMRNFAQSSEPYLASFLKIHKLLGDNPQISVVILGFGYHNLSSYYDDKLTTNESSTIFDNNIQLLSFGDLSDFDYNRKRFANSYLANQCIYPRFKRLYLGQYKKTETNLSKADLSNTLAKHFYKDTLVRDFSESFNVVFLYKIANLCLENNIRLILVKTPTTLAYEEGVPSKYKKKYLDISTSMMKHGVETFIPTKDASKFSFKDYSHLSGDGAGIFTPLLLRYIESNK